MVKVEVTAHSDSKRKFIDQYVEYEDWYAAFDRAWARAQSWEKGNLVASTVLRCCAFCGRAVRLDGMGQCVGCGAAPIKEKGSD